MTTKHTPGPHKVGRPYTWHGRAFLPIIRADFPRLPLCEVTTTPDAELTEADYADAARIVQCVNAHDVLVDLLGRYVTHDENTGLTQNDLYRKASALLAKLTGAEPRQVERSPATHPL